MNFFLKLRLIYQGWKNLVLDKISDIKYRKYFDARREICRECGCNSIGICTRCGCVIKAKVMSEDSSCPDGKWKTISETLSEKD